VISVDCRAQDGWREVALNALRRDGVCIVEGMLADPLLSEARPAMYRAQDAIRREIGESKLVAAGELGVLRLMLKFEPLFYRLLEIPALLEIVDAMVSPTAILHLQNGFILPSFPESAMPQVFQTRFHRDFPRVLNGYLASVNVLLAIDAFTRSNGATYVVPGSHQKSEAFPQTHFDRAAVAAECPAGSALVFDSTLWHAAGSNTSGHDRLAINQQFTRSWIKQQIDYVRALGEEAVLRQAPRTQQLLGYYTRVVTSLDEYYRPEPARLYRREQG
jgi:ectoine hydroxylase-related dioxygenase (phytanoyl-CoA dioxygenase family)